MINSDIEIPPLTLPNSFTSANITNTTTTIPNHSTATYSQQPPPSTLVPIRLLLSCDKGKEKALDIAFHYVKEKSKKRRKSNMDEMLLDEGNLYEIKDDSDDSSIIIFSPPIASQPSQRLPYEIISMILQRVFDQYEYDRLYYRWTTQFTLYQCSLVSKQFHSIVDPLLWRAPTLTHIASANRKFLRVVSNIPPKSSPTSAIISSSPLSPLPEVLSLLSSLSSLSPSSLSPLLSPLLSPPPLPSCSSSSSSSSSSLVRARSRTSSPPSPPPLAPYRHWTIVRYIRSLELFGPFWTKARLTDLVHKAALPYLTHLTTSGTTLMDDTIFHHLLRHWPHLTSLKLSHMYLTRNHFAAMGQFGKRLVDLNLTVCSYMDPTWLVLLLLPFSAQVVTSYYYYHGDDQDDDEEEDGMNGRRLQHFSMVDCEPFVNAYQLIVLQRFRHLTCLTLTGMRHDLMKYLLTALVPTPEQLARSFCCWPQLTTLALDRCLDLDDATWITLIQTHTPHLQRVELTLAVALTNTSLDAMAELLLDLQSVTLNFNTMMTPEGVRRFVAAAPQLMAMELVACQLIRPRDFFRKVTVSVDDECVVRLDPMAIEKIKKQQQQQ